MPRLRGTFLLPGQNVVWNQEQAVFTVPGVPRLLGALPEWQS